jgi:hypothetical protein
VEPPKAPADAGEKRVALVTLHPKMSPGESFNHASLNLDEIVSCHSEPFRRLPQRTALEIQGSSVVSARHEEGEVERTAGYGATRIPMQLAFVDKRLQRRLSSLGFP